MRAMNKTTTRPTTLETTSPTSTPCQDKNMTFSVSSANERALVEITPDDSIKLPVGNFEYKVDGCLFYVQVILNGKLEH